MNLQRFLLLLLLITTATACNLTRASLNEGTPQASAPESYWLALTPSGDVLVTETRQNRIRLLRDTNGDGADLLAYSCCPTAVYS